MLLACISLRPEIKPSWRSSGVVSDDETVSALPPGNEATTRNRRALELGNEAIGN